MNIVIRDKEKCINIEILPKNVDKGRALEFVAALHGLKNENIVSFGDSMNDAAMLEISGKGIIVANGRPDIIEKY